MSLVKDIKSYLVSKGISTPIYLGEIPDSPDEVIGLFQYAGQGPLVGADIERPGLQVRVRGSYETAITNIYAISEILSEVGNEVNGTLPEGITIDSTLYLRIASVQSPFPLAYDSKERKEFVQNFYITRRN